MHKVEKDIIKHVKPEYVYLTIPAKYVCVYHKILAYMADFGKTLVDDCTASCKGTGKNIISCWNLFQSAMACHELGREKEAEFFINYIKEQLKVLYKGSGLNDYDGIHRVALTPDGYIKAFVTCGSEDVEFIIDKRDSHLYVNGENHSQYEINDKGELIHKYVTRECNETY